MPTRNAAMPVSRRKRTACTAAVIAACFGLAACGEAAGDAAAGNAAHSGVLPRAVASSPASRAAATVRYGPMSVLSRQVGPARPDAVPVDAQVFSACTNPQTYALPLGAEIQIGSASVAGFSNASKLNGSALLGEPSNAVVANSGDGGLTVIGKNDVKVGTDQYFCELATFQLDDNGVQEFPPARATFLAFGFMPVTATVTLTQMEPSACTIVPVPAPTFKLRRCPITEVLYQDLGPNGTNHPPYTVVSTAHVSLRISDATVNGVPLNVGANCRADGPVYTPGSPVDPGDDLLVLTGSSTLNIFFGSVLDGEASIPQFTGCGTGGDNLDPLFDATLSGDGNYSKMAIGKLCFATTATSKPTQCEPSGLGHPLPVMPVR
jgi:hypothetical protein